MHLPTSASTDPTIATPAIPVANAAAASELAALGGTSNKGAPFEALFDELACPPGLSDSAAAGIARGRETSPGVGVSTVFAVTRGAGQGVAQAFSQHASFQGSGEAETVMDEESTDATGTSVAESEDAEAAEELEKPARHSDEPATSAPEIRGLERAAWEHAKLTDPAPPAVHSTEGDDRAPNEHASERAFEVPRFSGLPAAAREHRAAEKTPPGLVRDTSAGASEEASVENPPPAPEPLVEFSGLATEREAVSKDDTTSGRPTSWPGASAEQHPLRSFPVPHARASSQASLTDAATSFQHGAQTGANDVPLPAPSAESASAGRETFPANGPELSGETFADLAAAGTSDSGAEPTSADPVLDSEYGSMEGGGLLRNPFEVAERSQPTPGVPANFSIERSSRSPAARTADARFKKESLDSEEEQLANSSSGFGIGVAKPAANMSARFAPNLPQHPAFEYAGAVVSGTAAAEHVAPPFGAAESTEVSSAHAAVEVVLTAVEELASRDQKRVELQFSVGEADLSVRVELHGDEVRTTFRTDSAELRHALAQEWQAVATSSSADRSVRIVPAIFNAADNSALNAFAGDASSRQRDPHAQSRPDEPARSVAARARPLSNAVPVAATPRISTPTSQHLHIVA